MEEISPVVAANNFAVLRPIHSSNSQRSIMAQSSSNNGGTDQVLVEERASVRTFILNRSKQLNALSFQMVQGLMLYVLRLTPRLDDSKRMKIINRCFSRRTIKEIISSLENEALNKKDDWISSTIQSLKKASLTSLKISLRSIREERLEGVGSCLIREYRMVCHMLRKEFSKDFFEVEYAIFQPLARLTVDSYCRDAEPYSSTRIEILRLELIRDDVDRYFSKIGDEDWEDLKLPLRSNLPPYAIAKLSN